MLTNMIWLARFMIWTATLLFVFDNLGVNITAFVASLGIGGVAVALAAQSVLGDAFSSFAIFMDKPFQVGDFIIVGDLLGTVEQVGFKTTRLRSLGGEQLIFSNSDLTSSRIKNYKRMKERRVVFSLGVVYHTPVEKVKAISPMIKRVNRRASRCAIRPGPLQELRRLRAHLRSRLLRAEARLQHVHGSAAVHECSADRGIPGGRDRVCLPHAATLRDHKRTDVQHEPLSGIVTLGRIGATEFR